MSLLFIQPGRLAVPVPAAKGSLLISSPRDAHTLGPRGGGGEAAQHSTQHARAPLVGTTQGHHDELHTHGC